jgi:hypothetical protein
MIGLVCFVLTVLGSPFKPKLRLEAENAVLRHRFGAPALVNRISQINSQTVAQTQSAREPGSYSDFWKGAGVSVEKLSEHPLPETADEVRAVGKVIGAR